ncbi:hypothetical protein CGI33_20920 [Vibrio parahaemolyticus]|nr:hypothetical protein CGI33_20920 [Vibrio parahaemolyticus]
MLRQLTKRSRGTVNAWRVWLKFWYGCLGGKLKFGGSALLPLNAALVANEKNTAKTKYLGLRSVRFWLGFRISISSYLCL